MSPFHGPFLPSSRAAIKSAALSACLALALPATGPAQGFGRNQVRVRGFDWKVASTDHFDIHYYEGSEALVPFTARVLERSYSRLSRDLDAGFEERRPFFLYANVNDMQQSNIAVVGDGTGGVTEAFKDRFMVFNDGSRQWLDTVITHELTHVFQFRILISGFWKSARILKTIVYPLWMMEGMAEFYSWGLDDAAGEVVMRDAATSGGLIPLWKLQHFNHLKQHQVRLGYESGATVLEFLETEYGSGTVAKMIKLFESRFESTAVLGELIGLDIFGLDRKWQEYLKEKYRRVVWRHHLLEPEAYGKALTEGPAKFPEFNTSPVFTPDGKKMAYFTTRFGFPPTLMLQDLETEKARKLVFHDMEIETVHLGNFTNKSRVLAISADGRTLAFSGTKNHLDSLFLYDLETDQLRRVPVGGFMRVGQPAFSPDGRTIAFSGMKGSLTDIYLLDLETSEVRRLTDDPQDDQTPNFSPDGESVVYSSEIEVPGDPMLYQRRLYRVRLSDGSRERLLDLPGAARDPVHSADGKRLLFSLEADAFYEVYELDLETRQAYRMTRSAGAAYTPAYTPSGEIAFAGYRKNSIHIYSGERKRFLAEKTGEGIDPAEEAAPRIVAAAPPPAMKPERKARSPFTTDLFLPAFFYSSNGGLFWTSYWQGSDLLGNHQGLAFVSYASGPGFLDYQSMYGYNRFRTTFQGGVIGRVREDILDESSGLTLDESAHLQFARALYPLDRFHRFELGLTSVSDQREYQETIQLFHGEARMASLTFVRDAVRGPYGSRLRLGYLVAPELLGGEFRQQAVFGEAHKYFRTGKLGKLVFRGLGIRQWGRDALQFILGGIGGVRGYGRSTVRDWGARGVITSAEWRLPVIPDMDYYMWYIFPDFYFKAVSMAFFTDAGYVWDTRGQLTSAQWHDVRHSYGVGLRLHTFIMQLFPLVLHFDYAWRTTSKGEVFYVYLGPLF
ncbi:MAG: peptidase MA family metallohydrolase [Elusimicrobiota bacterium]